MSGCKPIAQSKWASVTESLRLLKTNEWPWAIHSGHSEEMSDSLKKCWLKKSKILFFSMFYLKNDRIAHSLFFSEHVSESLRSLTKNERCERIAQVAHQKWVTMSHLLTSLRGNERSWGNRSGCSPKMSEWVKCSFFLANRSIAHFWAKNERFAWKTNEQSPSPGNWWEMLWVGGLLITYKLITDKLITWLFRKLTQPFQLHGGVRSGLIEVIFFNCIGGLIEVR